MVVFPALVFDLYGHHLHDTPPKPLTNKSEHLFMSSEANLQSLGKTQRLDHSFSGSDGSLSSSRQDLMCFAKFGIAACKTQVHIIPKEDVSWKMFCGRKVESTASMYQFSPIRLSSKVK